MHSIAANAADATSRRALNWSPKVCRKLQAVLGYRVSQNWYLFAGPCTRRISSVLIADGRTRCGGFELSYATDAAYPRALMAQYVARPKRETSNRTGVLMALASRASRLSERGLASPPALGGQFYTDSGRPMGAHLL